MRANTTSIFWVFSSYAAIRQPAVTYLEGQGVQTCAAPVLPRVNSVPYVAFRRNDRLSVITGSHRVFARTDSVRLTGFLSHPP